MPHVLIVDDNREIRQLIGRVLSQDGYVIENAEDGKQAIEMIGSHAFDVILLDFMMPLASGSDVIRWIQENRPDVAKGSVIIITAAMRELKSFDTSTVYAAVAKPFDISELRNTVRSCVRERVVTA